MGDVLPQEEIKRVAQAVMSEREIRCARMRRF